MINKDTDVLMEKICRSCMSEKEDMKNVFETSETVMGQTLKIFEMLMACATVQITNGDGLPIYLCLTCEDKLNSTFAFKRQCEISDVALRELKSKISPDDSIKEESLNIVVQPDVDTYGSNDNCDSDSEDDKPLKFRFENNPYTCTFCQKKLRTKKGLKIHQRKHTGEKLHSCQICQAKFAKRNHLGRHMKVHGKKDASKHACDECDEKFYSGYLLAKHKREHADEAQENEEKKGEFEEGELRNGKEEGGLFECNFCKKLLGTPLGLRIHMRKHTGVNLARCEFCDKSFTKSSHLKRHLRIHGIISSTKHRSTEKNGDREKKVMECEFCDRRFVYRKSYVHHMHTEHGMSDDSDDTPLSALVEKAEEKNDAEEKTNDVENCEPKEPEPAEPQLQDDFDDIPDDIELLFKKNKKIHVCHVCGSSFARANHLTRHMTLHRAVLTQKCDSCDKAFVSSEFLEQHVKENHINKPYICTVCDKQFGRGEHLIRHLKLHDLKDKKNLKENLKCSICDKVFTRADHLARHTKMHLQQDKRHVCAECGKAFNRLDNLKTHQRIHTGIKDNTRLHLCVYCGKEFNNSSNMIVHMRRHTGERPYKCGECGKGFPRSHDLKCHERTHSGEKPYLCTLCGKSFNKSNKLLRHSRVHTGERPYLCNLCGRGFTQSNDLALHMRRHTGARPYACGMCPARFIQSGQLKAHRLSTGHWVEVPPELKGGHRVEPVTPTADPVPIKFKSHKKPKTDEGEEGPKILNQTVSIMGNISLHTAVGAAVQPFVLEGAKLEFHNVVGYTVTETAVTNGIACENGGDNCKKEGSVDLEKNNESSPSTFQNGGNATTVFRSEAESPGTFTQSSNYSFQNYS